jgi:hypothetical protein
MERYHGVSSLGNMASRMGTITLKNYSRLLDFVRRLIIMGGTDVMTMKETEIGTSARHEESCRR